MAASSGKEKICVLLTGGTICSVPNSNGKNISDAGQASPVLINHYRKESTSPFRDKTDFETVSLDTDILSENMTTDVWLEILTIFKKKILTKNYKGVIVLHGTDTLAYTSSFLSLALAGINIPVMMVSAQLSLNNKMTNGHANFRAAVELIMNGIAPNVYAVYRNENNEQNGKHEPGDLLVHYGSHLLQCPNGTGNFHSRDEMTVPDAGNVRLDDCICFNEKYSSESGPDNYPEVSEDSAAVCLIRPYTGLDYSEINLEGKRIVIHGTYHSESVCIGRSIYGNDPLHKDRQDFTLEEILKKDRKHSILYLLDKCAEKGIPVYLAPCNEEAAVYGTTANAVTMGAKPLKGITFEAAYAKAVLGCFLGKQGDEFDDFMSTPINGEM